MEAAEVKLIGDRMKAIRDALGMLQKDFAKELDISAATLSEIEAGVGKPRHEVIYNLTKKYSVNIYYVLHGKGKMFMSGNIERSIVPEKYGEYVEFLKEFLKYCKESTLVRYEMMTFFRTFMLEKEALIEKDKLWAKKE